MLFRSRQTALLAGFFLLASTAPLSAQDWAGMGRLQGIITDEAGKPIEGAKVTLRRGDQTVKAENPGPPPVTTDKLGKWSKLGLAGGTWGVLIEKDGFIPSEGRLKVAESGPPQPPVTIKLKVLPKEEAQKQKEPSKGSLANAAINDGNTALQQEKYAEAREAYQKALALIEDPEHPQPDVQVAILRAIATTYYRESTAAKAKDVKAQKLDQSIASLKQALAIKPDDPESLQLIANLLVDAGHDAEAQAYIAKLPQGAKIDPDRLINIGIKYYNEKQLDKALEQFNKVVTENPEMAEAYYYRGLVYLNKNKVPEAKADFKKLLEIDPKSKYAKEAQEFLKSL
jgi:Tfp pilus assembly protein PilF